MRRNFRNPRAYILGLSVAILGMMLLGPASRSERSDVRAANCDRAACADVRGAGADPSASTLP